MSKNCYERKYKWPLIKIDRKYRYGGVRSGEIDITAPRNGFHYFLAMSIPFLLLGTLFVAYHIATGIAVVFLVVGGVFLLISLYAYLAYREEVQIQKEITKHKQEKQKAWREKRRMEKKKHKHR